MAFTRHGHHIDGSRRVDQYPTRVVGCGGPNRCDDCHKDDVNYSLVQERRLHHVLQSPYRKK